MQPLSFQALLSLSGGTPFDPYPISHTVAENESLTLANSVFISYQEDGVFTLSSLGWAAGGSATMIVSGTLPSKGDYMDVNIVSGAGEPMALRLTRKRSRLNIAGTVSPPLPPG